MTIYASLNLIYVVLSCIALSLIYVLLYVMISIVLTLIYAMHALVTAFYFYALLPIVAFE